MFKHYVKVALRLIKRSFLFSSINMLGFVLGMTAAFLIYLWIVDELTFEDFQGIPGRVSAGGECDFYVEFRNFELAFGH